MVSKEEQENGQSGLPIKLTPFTKYIQLYKPKSKNKAHNVMSEESSNIQTLKTIKTKKDNKLNTVEGHKKAQNFRESPYKKLPHVPSAYIQKGRSNSSSRLRREKEILAESH